MGDASQRNSQPNSLGSLMHRRSHTRAVFARKSHHGGRFTSPSIARRLQFPHTHTHTHTHCHAESAPREPRNRTSPRMGDAPNVHPEPECTSFPQTHTSR